MWNVKRKTASDVLTRWSQPSIPRTRTDLKWDAYGEASLPGLLRFVAAIGRPCHRRTGHPFSSLHHFLTFDR